MKLTVLERIIVQSLIPKEGNFLNLKLIRKAKESLSFTEEENKVLNFRVVGEGDARQTVWDNADIEVDIDLGETVSGMVVKELKRLDEAGKLTSDQITVFEKFVEK